MKQSILPTTYATFPRQSRPHPLTRASWLSRAFFAWVTPLMQVGNEKPLHVDDLWTLQRPLQAAVVSERFAHDYKHSQSILRSFLASFGSRIVLTGVASFVSMIAALAGPLVLNHVVSALSSASYNPQELTTWTLGLLATQVIQALADTYSAYDTEVIAIQFTGGLKNLIYQKTLCLSASSRKEKSTGDISNLFMMDCGFILMAASFIHQLWLIPLQIICVGVLLYRLLGWAALAGLVIIVVALAINSLIASRIYAMYMSFMGRKDVRLQRVMEAFKSISIVKFNGWEDKFQERIDNERREEVQSMWFFMRYNALSTVMMWGLPVFMSVAAFGVYSGVMHQELTPAIVFTSVSLFQMIQIPLRFITDVITTVIRAKVSEERIGEFLQLPENDPHNVRTIRHPDANAYIQQEIIVAIEDATFGWDYDAPILRDVNLRVRMGDFIVVHGPVGCGKSSLCAALLGDMTRIDGSVYVGGNVAYCSQQPWIQHMTVRDNILFGRPYDRKKYEKVLEACALTKDLQSLPAGDRTEIGERGVNLSGGQKARVALARACYSDASVFILDAPLSAVDAIVQNEIFQKCLLGLLRNRTIILVTHNPEIIASEHVTCAVTINDKGELVETRATQYRRKFVSTVTPLASKAYARPSYADEDHLGRRASGDLALRQLSPLYPMTPHDFSEKEVLHSDADGLHRLIHYEERHEGRVGLQVFAGYYRAIGGLPVLTMIVLSQAMWQGLQIGSDLWLSAWSSDAAARLSHETVSEAYRAKIYAVLGVASALMIFTRSLTVSWFGLSGAKRMFDRMTRALLHAPMKFFDATPIGRLLMRYSDDVMAVDLIVPLSFDNFFACLFSVVCSIATTAVIIRWNAFFLLPIIWIYVRIGQFYLAPAREVERVLKTNEAPILSHLSETVEGGAVIRAYGTRHVTRFHDLNNSKLDAASRVWYVRLCITRWFGLRIQLVGSALVFVVAYSLVLLHDRLSPAIIGLAFSYVLLASQNLVRIIQSWSTVETTMVSPERIQQYIDVEQEAPHKILSMDPPATPEWPSEGGIRFENVSFRYNEGDQLVLKNLNLTVNGGEKIGIVGRTGAGKSSLTMALFRINELAGGSVLIDGVDVGKIGLKALREKLSIIPQNPVLFKGPLRRYLDPFDEYSDDALWNALRRVGLGDRVSSEEKKLECMVEENGENFSVGERQMLCMSRALLRKSRIVIFDEATASIDHETDQKLQRVIREAFVGSTVLTIAHRLDTILDADRILVLDGGEVVSFASPSALVNAASGHFYELMREGGYLDKFLQRKSERNT
ncbi:hypothetical protein Poli38472_007500 [Pythium oligandrum]|uniref:P-loop containing nucleoside triphosphate hydrolase protein n=1 Tax=Pythium oligandrum TaxID=41045 RepID=A0A8K1FRR0_PYTOL|nr:hypothetical protein Poli38472_007500 [Pythium oligandrum]|eukprot:TMW67828.1 hypothetical protein Poli38472_007500 [Pythium oligandrum]